MFGKKENSEKISSIMKKMWAIHIFVHFTRNNQRITNKYYYVILDALAKECEPNHHIKKDIINELKESRYSFDKLFGLCKALCVVNAYEEDKQLDCLEDVIYSKVRESLEFIKNKCSHKLYYDADYMSKVELYEQINAKTEEEYIQHERNIVDNTENLFRIVSGLTEDNKEKIRGIIESLDFLKDNKVLYENAEKIFRETIG